MGIDCAHGRRCLTSVQYAVHEAGDRVGQSAGWSFGCCVVNAASSRSGLTWRRYSGPHGVPANRSDNATTSCVRRLVRGTEAGELGHDADHTPIDGSPEMSGV